MDRIYLNGYIPTLQIPAQLIAFLVQHRKQKIPSPALLQQITQRFIHKVKEYAEQNNIPIIPFKRGDRKDDIAAKMRRKYPVKNGVVFIGIAQEKAYAFKGRKKKQKGYVGFDYYGSISYPIPLPKKTDGLVTYIAFRFGSLKLA